MKGLLLKDIQIALKQKKMFLIWLGVVLIFLFANQDPIFGVSYSLFLMVIILTGTISYDDFDNGMGFLMTLPVSRKQYVIEKYVFILLGTLLTGCFVAVVSVIFLWMHPEVMSIGEFLTVFLMLYSIMTLISSAYIPFQLKYGAEKGRTVLFMAVAIVFMGLFLIRKIESIPEQLNIALSYLNRLDPFTVAVGLAVIAVLGVLISVKISIEIVQKEEY